MAVIFVPPSLTPIGEATIGKLPPDAAAFVAACYMAALAIQIVGLIGLSAWMAMDWLTDRINKRGGGLTSANLDRALHHPLEAPLWVKRSRRQ
jgi:hypothetical protein